MTSQDSSRASVRSIGASSPCIRIEGSAVENRSRRIGLLLLRHAGLSRRTSRLGRRRRHSLGRMALVRNPSRRTSTRDARSNPVRSSRRTDRVGPALHGGSRSGRRRHRPNRPSPGGITSAGKLSQPSWSPIAQPRKPGHWHALGDLERRVATAVGSSGAGGQSPAALHALAMTFFATSGVKPTNTVRSVVRSFTWGRPPPLRVSAQSATATHRRAAAVMPAFIRKRQPVP